MDYRNLVDEIVDWIIVALPLDSRVRAANLNQNDFQTLKLLVVSYIRSRLDQMDPILKKELIKDCLEKSAMSLDEFDPATVILWELGKRLQQTHKLNDVNWG